MKWLKWRRIHSHFQSLFGCFKKGSHNFALLRKTIMLNGLEGKIIPIECPEWQMLESVMK